MFIIMKKKRRKHLGLICATNKFNSDNYIKYIPKQGKQPYHISK